jgi:hypothetical protein
MHQLCLINKGYRETILQVTIQIFEYVFFLDLLLANLNIANELSDFWVKSNMSSFSIGFQLIVSNILPNDLLYILNIVKLLFQWSL